MIADLLRLVGARYNKEKSPQVEIRQTSIYPTSHDATFPYRSLFTDRTIEDFVKDWEAIDVPSELYSELNFPPLDFIEWVRNLPRMPFDGSSPTANHKSSVSFLSSQIHRHWSVLQILSGLLSDDSVVIDLGSYPFAVPIALRSYSNFKGPLLATAIQSIDDRSAAILADMHIDTARVDIDPRVRGAAEDEAPIRIPIDDEGADLVLLGHVIEHLYHPMDILREARRVLKPGGRIVISTDNSMQLRTFIHLLSGSQFLNEPVENTAAMVMSNWRGHVRFFSAPDLIQMTKTAGFSHHIIRFEEYFYDTFLDDLFHDPAPKAAKYHLDAISRIPQLRNDIILVAS